MKPKHRRKVINYGIDPETGKKLQICQRCGVVLSVRELNGPWCIVCIRNAEDKQRERIRRGGADE